MAKRKSTTQAIDLHTSDPRDRCYTPAYALDPLLPYLPSGVIWEPAAGRGDLVRALQESGRDVIATELEHGEDFFKMQPDESWSVQVTNPPFSCKYHWIERSYALNKPWALLMPLETPGAWAAQRHFKQHGFEIMYLNKRVNFHMPNMGLGGSGANFPVAWFCWKVLPQPVMYGTIVPRNDDQLFLLPRETVMADTTQQRFPL